MEQMQDQLRKRVLMLGATGTAGHAAARAIIARGHAVTCLVRREPAHPIEGATYRVADIFDPEDLIQDGFCGERFDAVVSCIASRSGAPKDSWRVDYEANLNVLTAARQAGVTQFVLLSAICVQKPLLAFQHAKLAFEEKLMQSGLSYSIVRPTAFFKSLSGQIDRVRSGKPFLLFGDGTLTACKPISNDDLGAFIADCLMDPAKQNAILPIGGPGGAVTLKEQGEELFRLTGKPPKYKKIPVAMFDLIGGILRAMGKVSPKLAEKGELARIGRYYATESMLVWDEKAGRYDAGATPETGTETLFDYYAKLVAEGQSAQRGDHSVF
jgi:divinyl chlorophyllide a 8-vinyl-reductase